jgi:hypothetical protein
MERTSYLELPKAHTSTVGIDRKHKGKDNKDNGQAMLETFLGKLVNSQAGPSDIPAARIDDNNNKYDTQFEGEQTTLPDGFLQENKA